MISSQVTESKIKFVKAGSRVQPNCSKNIHVSLLNLASVCTVLSHMDSKCVILCFLAISVVIELIIAFEIQKRRILIE